MGSSKSTSFHRKVVFKIICNLLFVMGPKILYFRFLKLIGKQEKSDSFGYKTVKKWADFITRVAEMNITVEGLEKIPHDKTVLFISNHQSYADIPLLLHVLKDFDFSFMMKISLSKVPFIKGISQMFKCVPVNQKSPREAAQSIRKTVENIKNGNSMLIFPEGKRGFSNTPAEFKNGAFKVVQKTNVTVVPIYIRNVFTVFEGNNRVIAPADIKVTVLDPVETENLTRADVKVLHDRVYNIILDESKKYEN